jgi:hypothetical protein
MLTCVPTRVLAPTGAHPVNATPWLEPAPHHLDARRSLLVHTAHPSLNSPAGLPAIPFHAQPAAPTHHQLLSIPILLPR